MNASTRLARVVVDELVRAGIREAVLAPGSRSAALALALHAADAVGSLRLHVRVDERAAGFLAVGLVRGGHQPVPVVTTSGSAAAHLHPAVLEASHAGLPLLVLSADRPAELRGTGANQTADQVRLFGAAVRWSADVPAGALAAGRGEPAVAAWRAQLGRALAVATGDAGADPGPVHLNLCFAPPLVPDLDDDGSTPPGRPDGRAWTEVVRPGAPEPVELELGPRTVVLAGADAGPPARLLAERADWPLVAEPTSGARTGTHALRAGSLLLGHGPLADRVQRVVVAGRPTLTRPASALLSRPDVDLVALAPGPRWTDPGHRVGTVVTAATVPDRDRPGWRAGWVAADEAASAAVDALLAEAAGGLPVGVLLAADVARAVSEAVPPGGLLVVGSSNPVRDLDLVAAPYPPGQRRLVVANRGVSGIDGTVSTALGAALARDSTRSLALVGDLAFCHDAGGLLLGPDEPRPDLTVVVANDDGGSIFAGLEQGDARFAAAFERVFATPTGVDVGALCAAANTSHVRVRDLAELRGRIAERSAGVRVLEARVDRSGRRALGRALRRAVGDALSRQSQE